MVKPLVTVPALWTLAFLDAVAYDRNVRKLRAQFEALYVEAFEIAYVLEQRCGESKSLRELSKSLRRAVVVERFKAGEMRVKALGRRLRERAASATTAWLL